jgi:hypothetical protein
MDILYKANFTLCANLISIVVTMPSIGEKAKALMEVITYMYRKSIGITCKLALYE